MAISPDRSVQPEAIDMAAGSGPLQEAIQALTDTIRQASGMETIYRPGSTQTGSKTAGITTRDTLAKQNASRQQGVQTPGLQPVSPGMGMASIVGGSVAGALSPAFTRLGASMGFQPAASSSATAPAARRPLAAPPAGSTTAPSGGAAPGGGGGGRGGYGPPGGSGGGAGGGGDEGLVGGLLSSAQKIPGVGKALGYGLGLVDEIQSQRQKNAYYQSIEGTDNIHGFGERYNEALLGLTTMGMFAPGEASQIYKDATRLGYTDRSDGKFQSRQGAINFAYENKSAMGMDAKESSDALVIASRTATTSFTQLSEVLNKVSVDAGRAGVNANLARQKMMGLFDVAITNGLNGGSALQTSSGISSYQSSMGRDFQGANFTGMVGRNMNYMVAGINGMTYNQFLSLSNTDPAKAAALRQGYTDQMNNTAISPAVKALINRLVEKAGGWELINSDPDRIEDFWPEFLNDPSVPDWNAIKGILETGSGGTFDSDIAAFKYLVSWVGGDNPNTRISKQTKEAQVTSGSISSADKESFGKSWSGNSPAAESYIARSDRLGQRDPVMESIFKTFNKSGADQINQRVIVKTASGEREVSLQEAVEYFPGQLAAGKARFSGGQFDGKSVKDIGVNVDPGRASQAEGESTDKSRANIGTEHTSNKDSSSSTRVTIDLTDSAKSLLRVQGASPIETGIPNSAASDWTAIGRTFAPGKGFG